MNTAKISQFWGIILPSIIICLISIPAYAKYSDGTGEPNDPYKISTAEDLIALGNEPNDYDKHFILVEDIDLDPNLPGGKVFDKAVIAPDTDPNVHPWYEATPFIGPAFTGVFDGNGHTISHLTITGTRYLGLFGALGTTGEVRSLGIVDVNIAGGDYIGGLVGESYRTSIVAQCYSTGSVRGKGYIGGLVGNNYSMVSQCYSTVAVQGAGTSQGYDGGIGGLVGENYGTMTHCYSIGSVGCDCPYSFVHGVYPVGGLVGMNRMFLSYWGIVTNCFWNIQTSGQATSYGGTGKTTAEMQSANTFLTWGICGNESIWTIDEGHDYPRLAWENMPGEPIALGATMSDFLMGIGTQDDPYLIYTPDDLNLIGLFACEWDKHYRLMADIDMSGFDGKDGKPLFNIIAPGRVTGFEELFFRGIPFTGVFDGNGHTISHLTIRAYGCSGLFGGLEATGEVMDLGIIDVNIVGGGSVGGLVGFNGRDSSVTRCYSTGAVSGSGSVGGLVGYNNRGTVSHCYSACRVNGSSSVGGLVGHNRGGTVNQCHSTGAVTGTQLATGGLVGFNEWGSSVIRCYSTGMVSGEISVGGLVGANEWDSLVTQCYSNCPVTGESCVGGLAGDNVGDVTYCYSTGAVSGSGGVGGLVGLNGWDSSVIHCYSTGAVGGSGSVGGLVGFGWDLASECFWDTQTSGQTTSVGGTGKSTAEMQMETTFTDAEWDFVGETANGTEDIWWIDEGKDYPRLWWEKEGDSNITEPNEDIPPLYFFYAIHTHGTEDYLPYTNKLQKQLNSQTAENMIAAIEGISTVLDRYGVLGTWELVEGTAKGIPEYQGQDHVFKQLAARGHEIAAHAHKLNDTFAVVAALRDSCGVVPVTTSGFLTQISHADANGVQTAMSKAIQTAVDLGLTVGTDNLSPGGGDDWVSLACPDGLGTGNDMWPQTGNLMFPWRPDYLNGNICADNPLGRMVFVNHVSIEWLILPDTPGPPDVLDDRHFEQLKQYFDAAIRYMEENRPQRVACWGFVTHIIEYAAGGAAENPPEPSALDALDRFLSYVDGKRAEGRVIYATSSQIANLAFPK